MAHASTEEYHSSPQRVTVLLSIVGVLGGAAAFGSTLFGSVGLLLVAVGFVVVALGLITLVLARLMWGLLVGVSRGDNG